MDRTEELFKELLDEYPRELILVGLNEMSRLNNEGLSSFDVLNKTKESKKS